MDEGEQKDVPVADITTSESEKQSNTPDKPTLTPTPEKTPAIPSEQSKLSTDSSSSSVNLSTETSQGKATSTSSDIKKPPKKRIPKEPFAMHVKTASDVGKTHEANTQSKPVSKPGGVETRRRSSSAKGDSKGSDKNTSGAGSASSVPVQDGPGGAGGNEMMAKMMAMMSKGGAGSGEPGSQKDAVPDLKSLMGKSGAENSMMEKMMKSGGMPDMKQMMEKGGGMPDMMQMMMKGGGMPDMMQMMGKGGDMPDMMKMMMKGGGMPDMMQMMMKGGGMPDMKSMMGKGKGPNKGPMGMANLFDCIIEVALAKAESDVSEDDDDSVSVEIPCKYCSRFFSSQMSLKTHFLVAHEHEDTSVLNLNKLVIDGKGKRGVKDVHGARRKQSRDFDRSAAAGPDNMTPDSSAVAKASSSQEDLSGELGSGRGLKRGRSKGSEADDTTGAAGEEVEEDEEEGNTENTEHSYSQRASARLGPGAVPNRSGTSTSPDTRKRKVRMRSQRSDSGESAAQVTTKKKSRSSERLGSQVEEPSTDTIDSQEKKEGVETTEGGGKTATKPGKGKAILTIKEPNPPEAKGSASQRGRRTPKKDADVPSSDTDTGAEDAPSDTAPSPRGGRKGRQSGGGAGDPATALPLSHADRSPSATRRSLRNRKSR